MNDIAAENLHLWRGDVHVLRGVSFDLTGGECLQVTGINGSGKTTLLRALCGLMPLEEGRIRWRGADIAADPGAYHSDLAYVGHDNGLKGDLTALENLRFGIGLRRRVTAADCEAALAQVGLSGQHALPLRQLSAGQRRRVALARLPLMDAALWILAVGPNISVIYRILHTWKQTRDASVSAPATAAMDEKNGTRPATEAPILTHSAGRGGD